MRPSDLCPAELPGQRTRTSVSSTVLYQTSGRKAPELAKV